MYKIYTLLVILFLSLNTSLFADIRIIDNLTVTKIIDGDTIWVKDITNKRFYKVRFLGINAPELCTNPPQPFAEKSKKRVEELLKNQKIYIKYDSTHKYDKYNRLLGHIYRKSDNLWINHTLIKEGLAYVYIISSNIIGLKSLVNIENYAINNKINLWTHSKYTPINSEEAFKYSGQYKIVIGTVKEVFITNKNIWLRLQNDRFNVGKKYFFSASQKFLKNKYCFSVKINKDTFLTKLNWYNLKNKTIKVRGFINSNIKNCPTFINLIDLLTIELVDYT